MVKKQWINSGESWGKLGKVGESWGKCTLKICVVGASKSGSALKSPTLKMNTNKKNSEEEDKKWALMVERQGKGLCIVCGKALPPSFGTMEALKKSSFEKVTFSFCIPCMKT